MCIDLFAELDGESGVGLDGDFGVVGEDLFYPYFALLDGEIVLLAAVFANGNDYFIEQWQGAAQDVFVSFCYWVEGAREDCGACHCLFYCVDVFEFLI